MSLDSCRDPEKSNSFHAQLRVGAKIRLVKGIYKEPSAIAFKSRKEVTESYTELLRNLFQNSQNLFSISTHDDLLIASAIAQAKNHPREFEFGFLKGVRDDLKNQLIGKGYRVTEYVPYGEDWLPYSLRRLKEKPSNLVLLTKSLITQ